MKKFHAIAQANRQIGFAVVIEITRRASQAASREMNPRLLGHIGKSSVAEIVQQMAGAIRRAAHQKKIALPIAIVIKETSAAAWPALDWISCGVSRKSR